MSPASATAARTGPGEGPDPCGSRTATARSGRRIPPGTEPAKRMGQVSATRPRRAARRGAAEAGQSSGLAPLRRACSCAPVRIQSHAQQFDAVARVQHGRRRGGLAEHRHARRTPRVQPPAARVQRVSATVAPSASSIDIDCCRCGQARTSSIRMLIRPGPRRGRNRRPCDRPVCMPERQRRASKRFFGSVERQADLAGGFVQRVELPAPGGALRTGRRRCHVDRMRRLEVFSVVNQVWNCPARVPAGDEAVLASSSSAAGAPVEAARMSARR